MPKNACVATIVVATAVIVASSLQAQVAWDCERCITFCYPPYNYPCEYACEPHEGFCTNCYHNCTASYDVCLVSSPCYWASIPNSEPPFEMAILPGSHPDLICELGAHGS
jgi:hypothetical protein